MEKIYYRVECNHGSKYFDNGFEAFEYFQYMSATKNESVELWLIVKKCTKKLYSVKQELIAYSPCISKVFCMDMGLV